MRPAPRRLLRGQKRLPTAGISYITALQRWTRQVERWFLDEVYWVDDVAAVVEVCLRRTCHAGTGRGNGDGAGGGGFEAVLIGRDLFDCVGIGL